MNDKLEDRLVQRALEARARAYAPYSGFAVGAVALGRSGRLFVGVNVENASYGLTICAERNAIFAAVAAGEQEIEAIAVIADCPEPVTPCGACRQVIREFGAEIRVIMANLDGQRRIETIAALLPAAFDGSRLRGERSGEGSDKNG